MNMKEAVEIFYFFNFFGCIYRRATQSQADLQWQRSISKQSGKRNITAGVIFVVCVMSPV